MLRHTAVVVDCHGQNSPSWVGGGWIRRPFRRPVRRCTALQLAALDTLHDGLAGHAVGEGGLQHGEPAVGGVVDEQVRGCRR